MSKDIWHITNQDENTTDVPEKENFVVLIGHWTSCLWYGGEEPELIFWENVKKWCYLDELILENERTRKALDVAVDVLKLFDSGQYTPQPDSYGLKTDASRLARKALEQITALEQKD